MCRNATHTHVDTQTHARVITIRAAAASILRTTFLFWRNFPPSLSVGQRPWRGAIGERIKRPDKASERCTSLANLSRARAALSPNEDRFYCRRNNRSSLDSSHGPEDCFVCVPGRTHTHEEGGGDETCNLRTNELGNRQHKGEQRKSQQKFCT